MPRRGGLLRAAPGSIRLPTPGSLKMPMGVTFPAGLHRPSVALSWSPLSANFSNSWRWSWSFSAMVTRRLPVPGTAFSRAAQHRAGIAPAHARFVRQRGPITEAGKRGKRLGAGAVGWRHRLRRQHNGCDGRCNCWQRASPFRDTQVVECDVRAAPAGSTWRTRVEHGQAHRLST